MTNVSRAADFEEGTVQSGHCLPSSGPIKIGDRTLFPASHVRGAMVNGSKSGWAVMLEMEGFAGMALCSQMTPDGARMVGQMLIKMAGEVDDLIATQATAAIEAARKAPPASSSKAVGGDKTP